MADRLPHETPSESEFRVLTIKDYLAISAFWAGVSLHWAAFLTIVMQVRVDQLAPPDMRGTYLGILFAVGALISTVIELVVGPLSDRSQSRWGRRKPFILYGTLLSLPFILMFMATGNFLALVLCFVLIQLFLNWANGPYQAVIPDQVHPNKHGLASAYMGMMTLLGQAIGLAVAGLALTDPPMIFADKTMDQRLQIVGVILCLSLALTMAWTVLGMRDKPWKPEHPEQTRVTLAHMFDIRLKGQTNFRNVILSRFFFNLGFTTVTTYILFYLADSIGLGERAPLQAFIVMELAILSGVIGNWAAGVLSDRKSKKTVMFVCCAVLGVGTLAFLFTKSLTAVYALGIVFGMAWGAFTAVDWALASNLVPRSEAGRYMAIWHIAMTIPQVIAPLLAGPIADALNRQEMGLGWRMVFALVPVYLLIGAYFLRLVKERPLALEGQSP